MSKYIFLDIDGVLNDFYGGNDTNEEWKDKMTNRKNCRRYLYNKFTDIDSCIISSLDIEFEFVKNLNKIIKETNAKIIVSSSWRIIMNIDELAKCLIVRGFEYPDNILSMTPVIHEIAVRGREINKWLNSHCSGEVYKYAIIDDEDYDIKDYHDDSNMFIVKGLTHESAVDIIGHLNL